MGSKGRFRYLDGRGRRIEDPDKLERIEQLVIPPAWKDVWISPRAGAKLQATGVDKAGRRQYLYHQSFRAARSRRSSTSSCASPRSCPTYGRRCTHGVTTLSRRHVSVRGTRVTFRFRAKHSVQVRTSVVDTELAEAIKELLEQPGGARVFRYRRNGDSCMLTGAVLNDYIREHTGDEFTAKDFRTWGGTLLAAIGLAEHGVADTDAEAKKTIANVMRTVGERLGNTSAVARDSYVSPRCSSNISTGERSQTFVHGNCGS